MRITALTVLSFVLFLGVQAQTCVGTFTINIIDSASLKPNGSKLDKDVWFVFSAPEDEFYNDVNEAMPFEHIQSDEAFTTRHNEGAFRLFDLTENKDDIEFPCLCGLYLVQLEMARKKDTMRLGIYNIPAHQSFVVDSVKFRSGDFILDLRGDERLHEVEFDERGFFRFPGNFIEKIARKEE